MVNPAKAPSAVVCQIVILVYPPQSEHVTTRMRMLVASAPTIACAILACRADSRVLWSGIAVKSGTSDATARPCSARRRGNRQPLVLVKRWQLQGGKVFDKPGGGRLPSAGPQHHGPTDGRVPGARAGRGPSHGGRASRPHPAYRAGPRAEDGLCDSARTGGTASGRASPSSRRGDALGAEHNSPRPPRLRRLPAGGGSAGGSHSADASRPAGRPRLRRARRVADRARTV